MKRWFQNDLRFNKSVQNGLLQNVSIRLMCYLSIVEILELHDSLISSSGGARGIRDIESLESAVNQPRLIFDRIDLYPDVVSKAAAVCFSLVMNHPFVSYYIASSI